ncbi:hypothetical protein DWX95_05975 [Butyricicoccus sp. AF22-28AC]|nr:hypothetical protein DWX95_05975 [Butyricicoccus sp. AF22-28AC]
MKSGELRVKSTKLKIETGEWKMNVKFDGMHNEHPTNELRDTGITKGIFSCPRAIHPVSRLRRVADMCSSKASVNCEYFTKQTQE